MNYLLRDILKSSASKKEFVANNLNTCIDENLKEDKIAQEEFLPGRLWDF